MRRRVWVLLFSLTALALSIFLGIRYWGGRSYSSAEYRWHAELGSKDGELLVRGGKIGRIKGDIHKLIFAANGSDADPETFRTPEGKEPVDPPKLKLIGVRGEVARVEVINPEHLTQRMGSTGADIFMAEATFTLTENPSVKVVEFVFPEGDHAAPGPYARKDFLDRWKVVGP